MAELKSSTRRRVQPAGNSCFRTCLESFILNRLLLLGETSTAGTGPRNVFATRHPSAKRKFESDFENMDYDDHHRVISDPGQSGQDEGGQPTASHDQSH